MFDSSNGKNILSPRHQLSLHYSVRDLVAKINRSVLPERQITLAAALSVANREVVKNVNAPVDARIYAAQRAVAAFGSLATKNKVTTAALENSDLLAIGHPMSTKQHAMHDGSLRHARALWVAADSSIVSSEVRALVATAHALEPGSIEREHAFARLFAAGPAVVPITAAVDLEPIIAVLGLGLGGNSRAARSARARMQRRDRRGRFAFMGGGWSFSVKFPDGSHRGVSGKTIGASGVDDIEVDVRGSKYLRDGVYTVPAKQGIAARAVLPSRLLKNLPEREVSAEQQKYSLDASTLVRKNAPAGWTQVPSKNNSKLRYTTADGYVLDVPWDDEVLESRNEEEPDFDTTKPRWIASDAGGTLRRAVGDTVVATKLNSWDKVEKQALKDQDAYQKYLDSPEGQTALSSTIYQGVTVAQEEIDAQGPSDAKPSQGTDVVQQQSVTVNWQTEDGPVTKQGLAEWTKEYAPGVSADLLDDGTVKLTGSETNLRNAVDKATDGDYNATDYIMDSAQKESSGEPIAPVLIDTGASTSADPELQKMERAVSGFYDMEYGPGQIEMYNTQDSNDFIYVSDRDDEYYEATRDGYRATGKRIPGERTRTRRYTRPSGNTADLDPDDILGSLDVARQKGDMVRFNYKGAPRVAQPGTSYLNPKNSQRNVRMFDHKKGEERTFAVKDITASKPKQPKPEAAKLAPPAAPSVPGQAVDIPSTDVAEIAKVLNDAIASKSPVRFDYSGKTREFVPERIYTNPKTSKQNAVGFSKTDNEGRTFTLDKMSPPPPMGRPSVKPAAPEVTFEPQSPRPGFRDSYVDPRTGKTAKIPEDLLDKSMPPAYGLIYNPYLGGWYSAEIDPDAGFDMRLPEGYDPDSDPGFDMRLPEGFPREIIKDTPPSDVQKILDKLTPKNPDDGIVLYLNSQAIDGAINDLVEKSLIEPGTPVNRLSETDSVAQLETSIKKAILDKEDIAFTYHDKPRIVTPAEVVTNKIGKLQVKGFSRTDGEDRTFNIDKIYKPTAEVPTQVSDIKNMPQAEFDEYVEALWPSSEAAAPAELAQSSWPIDTLLPKESSAVARIDYDEDANEMLVAFKEKDGKGGGIYLYSEVSKNDYRGIASASSAGSAVGKFVKGRKFEKMNEVQASRWLASKFPVKPISTIDGNPMDDYLGEEPSVVRYLPPTRPKVTDADSWTNTRLDRFYDADGNLNKDGEDYNDERARTVSAGEPPAGGGPGGPSDAGTAPVGPRNKLQEVYNLTEKAKSIANKMIDSGTFDPDEAKKVNDLLSQADRLYTEFVGEVPGYDGYGTETFSSLSDAFAEAKSTEDVPDFDDALLDISRDLESFDQGGFGGPPAGGPDEPPAGDGPGSPERDDRYELIKLEAEAGSSYGVANKIFTDNESKFVALSRGSYGWNTIGKFDNLSDAKRAIEELEDKIAAYPGPFADVIPEEEGDRHELVELDGERGYSYGLLNKIVDKGAAFEAFTRDSYGWRSLGEFDTMQLAKEEITDLEDKIARRDAAPARDSTDDYKEAFDSMFVAPDGTYRPNVFDVYEPVGRRAEQSADYTDDPDVLATRYEAVDLAAAASRGIADGSGDALLDFEAGQEAVPVEAVLEALEKVGIDKESLLAKLYERIAKESNNNAIIDATKKASNDIDNLVLNDPDTSVAEKMSVAEAAKLNGQLGAPGFTDNAFNLISSHKETNPNILSLARDIETEPERSGASSSAEIISRYLPWAFSNDPLERDAFRAYWGLILLSDGGDSDNWFGSDFESNFMRMLAKTLGELADGDVTDGGEILDRLTNEYGGFTQFAVGRQRISQGIDDLSAPTTAAALYRLTSEMAAPSSSELQRYIFVDEGTDAFDKYTTVGSNVVFDPRSFSTDDVMSRKPNEAFATFNGKRRKLIFRVPPGEMDAFDIHNYSWLPSEQEHVGHGPLKVEKVEKIGKLTYAIDLSRGSKPADIAPERPAAAPGLPTVKNYGDVSSWTRVGQQLGSNSGGTFKDEDGNEYYVKTARSTSHAENEALASAFYKFFNIPASEVGLGVQDNDDVIITPMIPSTAGILQNYIGDAGTVAQLHDGFAIDAWLANYDVAGLEFDNVVVDSNGNAYRIDPGGALMWRAQGRRKDWFGPKVIELDSMRDQDTNYASSTLFGGMSARQVIDSGRKLLDITPSQIDDIVASVVSDSKDSEMLKDVLKRRRSSIFEQLGIAEPGSETIDAIPSGPSPSNYVEPVGFEAQDLQPGDVAASDSFVIERIFRDGDTPSGKVSVQGYFPGHESQRKEWNEKTTIEVSRGGGVPPKGTAPALHRPKAPRKPSPGAFNGKMAELLKDAKTWEEAAAIIRNTPMVFFDYETTGLPGPEKGGKNEPTQIGAVKVVGGKVADRFSSYMNPEHELSDWSADNLKKLDGSPVTDDWLKTQASKREAHEAFLAFVGDGPVILGGQYTPFDLEILGRTLNELGLSIDIAGTIDSKDLSSGTLPKWSSKTKFGPNQVSPKDGKTRSSNSLGPIAEFLQVQLPDWHRADADAEASWEITDAMLTRAIDNPDTPKTLLNVDDSYAETQRKLDEYNKEYKRYEEELAEYAAAKAIAAAWNCGGSGITAAVGPENGPCSVPDIETIIREATPAPIGEIDPDGVTGGSTANETSMSDALEIDDPKYDGVDTNNPYKDEAFMPTEEQRDIIDAIMRGDDVVVEALAGTGKTSTLLIAGKRKKKEKPTERGVYIAFNKSAQLEAQRKFGDAGLTNIEVVTNDAISYRWAPQEIKDKMKRLKKKSPLAYYKDFAKEFGITAMEGKTLYEAVNLFKSAVNQYMISADDELGIQHFNAAGFEGDAPDWMLNIANNIWSDYTSPDGKAKINNTVVTKMWALARPDLSQIGFGLQSTKDFIFFDEAQDINPVSGKVILDQSVQTVYVGDENQAIYGFRGGENQLAKVDKAVVRLPLTKSFRFGKNIANEGNKWLQLLGSPLRIEGAGSTDGNVVAPGSLLATANAILVRTNSGGFGAIFDQLGRGRIVGVTKNYRDDLVKLTDSAEYLITGEKRPSELHEEMAPFKSWAEVEDAIANEDIQNKKVEKFAELVDELGIDGLRDLIDKLRLVKGTGNIADTSEEAGEIGDVTPGSTGDVGMGVEYTVTDAGVSLSGNTYATRDAIKATKRFSYNGTTKTWDAKTKGEEDTFDLLNNLSTKISGDSGLAKKDTGPIDVMVTTVHQAKGLEWPSVAMWTDFFTPRVDGLGELVLPAPTEQKIAYVAVTRAMENLDLGGLDWINSVITPSAQDDDGTPFDELPTSAPLEAPATTPTPAETPEETPQAPKSEDFIDYANERIVLAIPTTIKERFDDALEDYADLDSLNEKKVKSFRKKVAGAMDAYKDGQYVDAEEMLRDAAELLDGTPFEEPLKSFLLQAADAADAVRAGKAAPVAPKTPEAPAAPVDKPKLDPEWRPSDVAPPQEATPSGTPAAPDDLLPVSDAPKTAGQEAEEKNKAFRSDATKSVDVQQKFDDLAEAVDIITGEDGSLKAMYRKRVREAMEKVLAIRKKLNDKTMSEQEALDELQQILDGFPEVISSSAESIDINFFRDMVQGVLDVLNGKYYWRPTGKHLPPLDAVDSTGRPVGYSRDGNTFIEPGMRVRDKWGFSGTVEGYNTNDWINVNIRYDIDWRDPDKVKKGSWGPGVGRRSMNPSTLTVLTPDTDNDSWIDLPTTPETKKPRADLVEKQKKDWAKLKVARDYEAAARAAELNGEEAPPIPPGLALMKPSADLVRDSKKTKANISPYFNDTYDDQDVTDSTNDFSLSKNSKIIASDAVITTTDATGDPLVLMISRKYGPFTGARSLPGGFKDEGESFEAAADREMMEEVGISADQATSRTYLGEVSAGDWDPRAYKGVQVGAVAYQVPPDTPLKAGDDATGAEWVPIQDIIKGTVPIAFGHATWLAEAFKGTKYEAPLLALVRASKERNARLISQINAVRIERGLPTFDTPSPELWTPIYPDGDGGSGGDLPKADAPEGAPEAVEEETIELDNSQEKIATLGNNIATPDLRIEGRGAAPDHTPPDEEIIEMFLDGLTNPASDFVTRWSANARQFKQGDDPEAEDIANKMNTGMTLDKYDQLAADDPFLQNLYGGVVIFTTTFADSQLTITNFDWGSSYMDDWKLSSQPTYLDDLDGRVFWTDIAKYLYSPELLATAELTPAVAFLRTVRAAKPVDQQLARFLKFDEIRIDDEDHPFYDLAEVGQEIELRPSSWTAADNLSVLPMAWDASIAPGDSPEEFIANDSDNNGHVVLRVEGVPALNISFLSSITEEKEYVVTDGKYVVSNVKKTFTNVQDGIDLFYTEISLKPVATKAVKGKAVKGKAAAPEKKVKAPKKAAEIGDEISVPTGDQSNIASRIPDDSLEKAQQAPEAVVPSKAEFIPNSYFTEILQKYYNTAERAYTDGILTQKDWDRIQSYFGADSIAVNNFLRSGKRLWLADDKDTIENVVKSIDDIFNVAGVELPGDVIVFRGIYDADKLFPFGVAGATPGDVFTDPGYSSTSIKSDVARTFTNTDETATVLAITVPSGTKMLANRIAIQAGQEKKEQEILLPRGLTFTVTSIKERTKPNKTYPFLPEVYKEIAVTVVSTSGAKTAAPEKVEAPEAPEAPDLEKVTPTGRPPVRVTDPKPLTTSAFQGIMSLSDAVSHVIGKKQNDNQLGASALVDAADIEDLDVHVSVTEEDTKQFLQIKFKLTPWAALAQLNKIQQPESPLPEFWDMRTPEVKKRTLKDNSRIAVTNDTAMEFASGIEYVHDDTKNNVSVSLTSAQKSGGKLEILDTKSSGAPAALHGQVVIRLPIDATMSDVENALSIAGVRDVRAATKEDAKIVIENKLLSLFKQFNDPLQNVEEQDKRDALLADILEDWGVAPDDVTLVPGQHGRINYILPDATATQISLKSGTGALAHVFSLSKVMMGAHEQYYGVISPGDEPTYEGGGAMSKTFKSPTNQYAVLIPEIVQVNAVAGAVYNAIKYGLLSGVTRHDVGLQYSGMSGREDMHSGGADYVFLTPKPSRDISYYEQSTQLARASVIFSAENIFNRLDLYANAGDLYGRRVPGTDAIEESKPYGYETVVKHGVDVAAPGVLLNVNPKVRDRVLEMFKEEGITQVNGVELTELMPITSKFETDMAIGNEVGAVVSDAVTSAGGNPNAITFGEVTALLQLTGAPASYSYVPPSSKVLMTSRVVRANKAKPGEDSDDLDTSNVMTTTHLLYIMHPNGNLALLQLNPISDQNQYGRAVGISMAESLALGLGSTKYKKDIGAITKNMTGNSFIAEDTGYASSDYILGQLLFPAGQKDAGVFKPDTEQLQKDGKEYRAPKTYDEYNSYLNEFIDRYGYSPALKMMTTKQRYEHYIDAYHEVLNLYISDIGSIVNSDGKSLRAAIVTALLTVRNRILLQDDDLPLLAAAEPSGLPPVDYDVYRMTGNYITVPQSGAVIENIDGERAGELRDVYHVGITTTTSDGITPTGTYVEIETSREGRGGYYLDSGTSVTIDPVTNEIQFSSRGIKYMIRARRPSDEKYSRERAQQDGTR